MFELGTDGPRALGHQTEVVLFNLCLPPLRRAGSTSVFKLSQEWFPAWWIDRHSDYPPEENEGINSLEMKIDSQGLRRGVCVTLG